VGLSVKHLELTDFRSYGRFRVEPDPKLTILVGANAAGKTNIIEALDLLTAAESFRHPSWGDVVRWGTREARATLSAEGEGRLLEVTMHATAQGRRTYQVNGKTRRRISEVAGILPSVVFTPDDLRVVKDSADKRRAAVDGMGDQLSPAYRSARIEYERILRHRNAILREQPLDREMMDVWTARLADSGLAFGGHRQRLFERLAARMSEVYRTLSGGEELESRYRPSWADVAEHAADANEGMRVALEKKKGEEIGRGTSLVGPHRDDISFTVNGHDARNFASQGQQRTVALAWKLSEVGVITDVGGQPPVLLLDDVMSELDEARRQALTEFVGAAAQTFVTTTNLGYFEDDLVRRAKVVSLT
jgi:DNA replication and repair protein RecF